MSIIRGVILDVDGTLVDSNDAHAAAWVEACAEHGYTVSFERVRALIGMGGDKLLPAAIDIEKDSPTGKAIEESRTRIFKTRYLPKLGPFPDAHELLQAMRDHGLRLVVASSAKEDELKPMLELCGANGLIEEETSSKDAPQSKPAPDIVQAALDRLKLPTDEVIMLGDTPYDVEAATKAHIATIAVRCGGWSDEDLQGAIAIYDAPAALLAEYDRSPFNRRS